MIGSASAPARRRFFYGWVIVAVMSLVGAFGMALATINFALFIRPMGDELGIGRAVFGWSQTARMATGAVASPFLGRILDRVGSRLLLVVAALVAAGSLVVMAFIQGPWQMVALFAIMGFIGLGGPAGNLITTVPVAKWFVRQRGRAMALASVGPFAGGVVFVPVTQLLIAELGWRGAWIALAAIGAGVIVPLSLVFVRRQPEDMGLAPDGDPPSAASGASRDRERASVPGATRATTEQSWTLQEAIRSSAFWRVTAVFTLGMFALGTVGLHRIPDFMDRGLAPGLVALATSVDAAAGGLSTFLLGFVAERVPARFLGFGAFLVLTLAVYLTIIANTPLLLFLAMGAFGTGIGGLMLLQSYLWAEYFGRGHIGSIRGFVTPFTLLFGGLSAPLAGYFRDVTGSYAPIWWPSLAILLVAAFLMLFTPRPEKAAPH
ncbi:MAG: MFS transporter [Chloroflexi bacterium]|nr:MFS transporter [Chloroflexota bacterium]